jgi:hypothetical protein
LETVVSEETGIFFEKQDVESLNFAIKKFEKMDFNYLKIREHTLKFDKKIFRENILNFLKEKL